MKYHPTRLQNDDEAFLLDLENLFVLLHQLLPGPPFFFISSGWLS
jgi:hypothetical protein